MPRLYYKLMSNLGAVFKLSFKCHDRLIVPADTHANLRGMRIYHESSSVFFVNLADIGHTLYRLENPTLPQRRP